MKHTWVKIVVASIGVLAVLWVAGCVFLYRVMCQPPEHFGRFMSKIPAPVAFLAFPFETLWMRARAGTLHTGDLAPDFTLIRLDKSATVQLSALTAQHRPAVLLFGSYT